MTKPNILITNDDGVHAPGIRQLWNSLVDIANVTVVAPSQEMSSVGLSITTRNPLKIEKIHWDKASSIFSVSGTPADCIKMGLSVILDNPPDLVVSGINRGTNAGRNVLYSGTVAGVIEAVMHNIPGVAFSLAEFDNPNYSTTTPYIRKIVDHVMEHPLPQGTLLNVNFPKNIEKGIKGFKLARQGREVWMENPDKRAHPYEKDNYYWLGIKVEECEEAEDSDITWLKRGYLTAVPVYIEELTHHKQLSSRKALFDKLWT